MSQPGLNMLFARIMFAFPVGWFDICHGYGDQSSHIVGAISRNVDHLTENELAALVSLFTSIQSTIVDWKPSPAHSIYVKEIRPRMLGFTAVENALVFMAFL